MDQMINCFKALSDKNRLRIIATLMEFEELCACQITELLQVKGATASRHMAILILSGLVTSRKDGRWVYYKLQTSDESLVVLLELISSKIANSIDFESDKKIMRNIVKTDPVELCKKQRGVHCCN